MRLDIAGFVLVPKDIPFGADASVKEVLEGAEFMPIDMLTELCRPPLDEPAWNVCSSISNGGSFGRTFRSSKYRRRRVDRPVGDVGEDGIDNFRGSVLDASSSNSAGGTSGHQQIDIEQE